MRARAFGVVSAAASIGALVLIACESVPVGPSLANVAFTPPIQQPAIWKSAQKPTVGMLSDPTVGDPTVCCCHVVGSVSNANSVPTHVIIQFAAIDSKNTTLGTIVEFVQDLQPRTSRQVEVSGFLMPCNVIDHVVYQINVSSVGTPIL